MVTLDLGPAALLLAEEGIGNPDEGTGTQIAYPKSDISLPGNGREESRGSASGQHSFATSWSQPLRPQSKAPTIAEDIEDFEEYGSNELSCVRFVWPGVHDVLFTHDCGRGWCSCYQYERRECSFQAAGPQRTASSIGFGQQQGRNTTSGPAHPYASSTEVPVPNGIRYCISVCAPWIKQAPPLTGMRYSHSAFNEVYEDHLF